VADINHFELKLKYSQKLAPTALCWSQYFKPVWTVLELY